MFKIYYNSVEREFGVIVYLDQTMDGHNSAIFTMYATDLDDGTWYHLIESAAGANSVNHGYIRAADPEKFCAHRVDMVISHSA